MASHYAILGLSKNATKLEIRLAYRKLALKYHPDKTGGNKSAELLFKEINNAYQILSNPEKRAQYDFELNYSNPFSKKPYASPKDIYWRPNYSYTSHNHTVQRNKESKQNFIISWIVTGIMTAIVLLLLSVEDHYRDKQKQEFAQKQSELLSLVQEDYKKENYKIVLEKLHQISIDYPEFDYLFSRLRMNTMDKIKRNARIDFSKANYKGALDNFLLLRDFSFNKDIYDYFITECYMALGEYGKGLEIAKNLLRKDSTDIRACLQIAQILSNDNSSFQESLIFYDKAVDLAVEYYTRVYGKAFIILVEPQKMPSIHYDIFLGRAKIHFKLHHFKQSINDSNWAICLKPNTVKPLLLIAENYYAMNHISKACERWREAVLLGENTILEKFQQYCKN